MRVLCVWLVLEMEHRCCIHVLGCAGVPLAVTSPSSRGFLFLGSLFNVDCVWVLLCVYPTVLCVYPTFVCVYSICPLFIFHCFLFWRHELRFWLLHSAGGLCSALTTTGDFLKEKQTVGMTCRVQSWSVHDSNFSRNSYMYIHGSAVTIKKEYYA